MYDVDSDQEFIGEPEPRPRRRTWRTAKEREQVDGRAAELRTATFAGGASAQQIVRIRDAWETAVSPFADGARARAVAELLRVAADAKWSPAELSAWMDKQIADVTAARAAVLAELRTRLAARSRAA